MGKIKLQKVVGNLLDKVQKLYSNGTTIYKIFSHHRKWSLLLASLNRKQSLGTRGHGLLTMCKAVCWSHFTAFWSRCNLLAFEVWPCTKSKISRFLGPKDTEVLSLSFRLLSSGADPGFFRRGCTRLLLYFNTIKPHSFFLQNTSCIRNCRSSQGGGGAHLLHPPPRSAPGICGQTRKEDPEANY